MRVERVNDGDASGQDVQNESYTGPENRTSRLPARPCTSSSGVGERLQESLRLPCSLHSRDAGATLLSDQCSVFCPCCKRSFAMVWYDTLC